MSLPGHGHFHNRAWRREYIGQFQNASKNRMKSKRLIFSLPGTPQGKHAAALGKDCRCGGCSTKSVK